MRQAIHIDSDKPSHIITGVFGLFDSIVEAEEFIFNSSDASVRHTNAEHSYTDGEHYYTISTVRHPVNITFKKSNRYVVSIYNNNIRTYLRKRFFDEVLRGDVPSIRGSDITKVIMDAHVTDDHALAVEVANQLKNVFDSDILAGYEVAVENLHE